MNTRSIPAALLLLFATQSVTAIDLNPVVVTATRTAQTVDDTLASVSVITREDIEQKQFQSVQDALRGLPGIDITNNGGPGKATSVFLRGTESDHVLVLIDGIKVGSATLGTTAFQNIPIEQIERIEVVRGPRSSIYGSEAIGGVIQIFTRKGGGKVTPYFSIGGGTHRTFNGSVGVSGGGERGWFNLSASAEDTQGFNSCEGPGGCFTIEPDKDGYNNLSGSLRAGYRFKNGLEVDAHALRTKGDVEFDGGFQNETDSVQQVLGGSVRYTVMDFWHIIFTGGQSQSNTENFKDGVFASTFDTERDTLSLQNDLFFAENHLVTLGLDYQDDRVESSTVYTVDTRNNKGIFAQYQGELSNHHLQAALRRDNNEQFGSRTTGSAAWGYSFHNGLRLSTSYGTAFKAPTFNELFFPGFGNPNLEPEESRSLEIGLSSTTGWGRWAINAYETRVDDLIAFNALTFAPDNINEARIRGLEASLATQFNGWNLNTSFTMQNPKNRSGGAFENNLLPRRSKHSFKVDVDRSFGNFALGATLFTQGKRFDDLANSRRLGGYSTVALRGEYTLAKDWRLQARLDNLLDKEYQTASFFNQQGRSVFLTLRYQP